MLKDLTAANQAKCFEDSVSKPIFLFLYQWLDDPMGEFGGDWMFYKIEETILSESMEYSEGILEGQTFEFGSIVMPQMSIQWKNPGESYKGMLCIPVQKIGTQYIKYFEGFIDNEEVSEDTLTVSGTLYPTIYYDMDWDLKPLLSNSDFGYDGGMTLAEFLNAYLGGNARIDVSAEDTLRDQPASHIIVPSLIRDIEGTSKGKTAFDKYDTFTVQQLLQTASAFMGCAVRIKCKEVLNQEDFNNLKNIQPYVHMPIAFVDLPNTRKALSTLPAGYTQIPFIWAEDAASIDTGIYPNDTTEVEITFSQGIESGSNVIGIFPAPGESNSFRFFGYSGEYYLDYGSGDGYNRIHTSTQSEIFRLDVAKTIRFGNRFIQVNGKTVVSSSQVSFTQKNNTMIIGNSQAAIYQRFYGCSIIQNGELVREYVPCRDSAGNVGLYDKKNNTFSYHNNFKAPEFLEALTLPYCIKSRKDLVQRTAFNGWEYRSEIPEGSGTETQLYYSGYRSLNTDSSITAIYTIPQNLFLEAWVDLSTRYRALGILATKIFNIDYIKANIQSVYAPFLEPGDFVINQTTTDSSAVYLTSDIITIPAISEIGTYVFPNSTPDFSTPFQIKISFYIPEDPSFNECLFIIPNPETANRKYFYAYVTKSSDSVNPILETHFGWNGTYGRKKSTLLSLSSSEKYTLIFTFNSSGYIITGSLSKPVTDLWEYGELPNPEGDIQIEYNAGLSSIEFTSLNQIWVTDSNYIACRNITSNRYGLFETTTHNFISIANAEPYESIFISNIVPTFTTKTKGIHQMISDYTCDSTIKQESVQYSESTT